MSQLIQLTPAPLRLNDDIVGRMFDDMCLEYAHEFVGPTAQTVASVPQYPEIASRWLYTARDGQTMPVPVQNALEAFRIESKAILGQEGMQAIAQYDAMVRQDMDGFTKRREAEHALAEYIKAKVLPVAMPHEREKLEDMARSMLACRTSGEHGIAVDAKSTVVGKMVRWVEKCGFPKLCPDESRVEGQRIAERYLPLALAWVKESPKTRRIYYAVLTEPNYPVGGLHEGKRDSFKRWSNMLERIRDNKSTRARVGDIQGALLCQEDPLSALGTWNGHINALLLVEGDFSYKEFRAEWGFNVEIQHLKPQGLAKAFIELCKYQAKAVSVGTTKDNQPGMVDWAPELWLEWWRANTGFRRTRPYGVLYGAPKPESPLALTHKVWLGSVRWNGRGYSVKHYDTALQYVDLIQGNKSGLLAPQPPKKRRRGGGNQGPDGPVSVGLNPVLAALEFTEAD